MAHEWAKGLLAALLLGGLLFSVLRIDAWQQDTPGVPNAMEGIADDLFDTWVLAFELLSVLLLAALIGALFMSAKRPEKEDRP